MKHLKILTIMLIGFACQPKPQTETTAETTEDSPTIGLVKLWASDSSLTTNESIIYHPGMDVLFVSCIGSVPPDSMDNDGFIAQVSPANGEVINLKWVDGISAPKGMGIVGNSLFVTNINEVLEIDIEKAEIIKSYPIEGAGFLNDISVGADSTVYISDTGTNKIHQIKNQELGLFLESADFKGPNGLLVKGNDLFVASYRGSEGNFIKVDMSTKELTVVADSIVGGDGIVSLGEDFIVSTWPGEVYLVAADGTKSLLQDTREAKINAADIWFISDISMLLIPTFFDNRIVAYGIAE
ncbi:hypothetical protein N6H18_16935 [Reichenbachiella agarivorans]|uniref:Sugar lactone lactonase YvrE n=1 Tax=Reichenbachiella agarivorans TaxID=2979464 RepID=A0ABY6CNE1_9BACT|nr:hypothetical protein [Reichenbachiella agarivorans]UXP32030.1 hypothetical protein N6H18_16935 [Reichenbachiella agarivorans]